MNIKFIRSNRKTMAIEVNSKAEVIVRIPLYAAKKEAEKFVSDHYEWILKHYESAVKKRKLFEFTDEEIAFLKSSADNYIKKRAKEFSEIMELYPKSIKITSAKTRFGSCSGDNRLCFSYILMLYPKEAVDYVIVHELAHIKEHNHSKKFYKLIEKYMPDYKERIKLLKKTPDIVNNLTNIK